MASIITPEGVEGKHDKNTGGLPSDNDSLACQSMYSCYLGMGAQLHLTVHEVIQSAALPGLSVAAEPCNVTSQTLIDLLGFHLLRCASGFSRGFSCHCN